MPLLKSMERCEKCGSANTIEVGLMAGNGFYAFPLVQRKKVFPKTSGVTAVACTDCGALFAFKLKQPEKFKPFVGYSVNQ